MRGRVSDRVRRYNIGQSLGAMKCGEWEFFPCIEDESEIRAASRIRSLLGQWKPTYLTRWSVRKSSGGVVVTRVGEW